MTAARRSEAGFTLVELLVTLLLVASAATLLTAALAAGRSVAARGEAATARGESVAAAQDLLRERIERLLPDGDDTGGAGGEIEGDTRRFGFIAPPLGNDAAAGLTRYRLALGDDGGLALSRSDARAGRRDARWTRLPLIGDVRAVEIAYFGAAAPDEPPRWRTDWIGRRDPPDLVRVRLRFQPGDPRRWPDLIVRPAATVSAGCVLDPATHACRA